jgi:hypothetical protein
MCRSPVVRLQLVFYWNLPADLKTRFAVHKCVTLNQSEAIIYSINQSEAIIYSINQSDEIILTD